MRVSPKVARTTTHDADLARKRLREKCLLTIQKERADKRSTTLAHMRQSAWLSHVMQEEAREGVLSEEVRMYPYLLLGNWLYNKRRIRKGST